MNQVHHIQRVVLRIGLPSSRGLRGGCQIKEVPIENDRSPVEITINLSSNGDICLIADTETFLTPGSEAEEDAVG